MLGNIFTILFISHYQSNGTFDDIQHYYQSIILILFTRLAEKLYCDSIFLFTAARQLVVKLSQATSAPPVDKTFLSKLRKQTGFAFNNCRKALVLNNNDFEKVTKLTCVIRNIFALGLLQH